MLIHELHQLERTKVVDEATIRTRYLWPDSHEGSLAHGVWGQLLKDLSTRKHHLNAVDDWVSRKDHWYAKGFGVDQVYLDELLNGWAFLGEGRDLSMTTIKRYVSETEGSKVCRTCGEDKPLTDYHRHVHGKDGRMIHCAECRRKALRKYHGR